MSEEVSYVLDKRESKLAQKFFERPQNKGKPYRLSREGMKHHQNLLKGLRKKTVLSDAREWFAEMAVFLDELDNALLSGAETPQPGFKLSQLVGICRSLADGKIPEVIEAVARKGRPQGEGRLDDNIRVAVTYAHAVKSGIYSNLAPTKMIREHYGVAEKTVCKWNREYEPYPANWLDGRTEPEFRKMVKSNGEYYQKHRPNVTKQFPKAKPEG